jgi:hypothetical protein
MYPRAEHRMTGDVLAQVATGEVVELSVRVDVRVGRVKVLSVRQEVRLNQPPPRVVLERDREWRRQRGYRVPDDPRE